MVKIAEVYLALEKWRGPYTNQDINEIQDILVSIAFDNVMVKRKLG